MATARAIGAWCGAAMCACTAVALAQSTPGPVTAAGAQVALPAATMPAVLRDVGFDQHLNEPLPLDLHFQDELNRDVALRRYFGSRPVVLMLAYYNCPMLCLQTLNSLASTAAVLPFRAGRDFEIVIVSFDPHDTPEAAAAKKAALAERAGHADVVKGWHFLTGEQSAIARLTAAVGFRYVWDERVQQFAHPTGLITVTPDGRIARYLFGIDFGPRDLRLAVLDAARGQIGSPTDAMLLYCYHYDPATGRYSLVIMRVIQLAGAATVMAMSGLILFFVRRERRGAL